MKLKLIKIIVVLFLIPIYLKAQNTKIDSLESLLKKDPNNAVYMDKLVILYSTVNPDISEKYAKKSFDIRIKDNDTSNLPTSVLQLGNVYWLKNDYQNAKEFLRWSYKLALKKQNYNIATSCLSNIGRIYLQKGKPKQAVDTLLIALDYANKIIPQKNATNLKYTINCSLGECFNRLGQNQKALEYLLAARAILDSNNVKPKSLVFEGLMDVYNSIDDRPMAIKTALDAISYSKKDINKKDILIAYYNLGNLYAAYKNKDSSSFYLNITKQFQKENNLPEFPFIKYLEGQVCILTKEYDNAINIFKELAPTYTNKKEEQRLANSFRCMGEAFNSKGLYDSAILYYNKALPIYKLLNLPLKSNDILLSLSQIKMKQGNYEEAYKNLQNYQTSRDTILLNERPVALADLEVKYKTAIKEATISKQETEISTQKQRNLWLIIGSIFITIVATILAFFYNRIKKQKAQIQRQKQEILHNNRNNIQQLISIFSRQAEDETLKENALANQERLFTLNLLNKLLYENGESNQANIKDYLNQLCQAKQISAGNTVQLNVSTPSILLNSNLLKDIGLIVNELTTNSIKYSSNNTNPLIIIDVTSDNNSIT